MKKIEAGPVGLNVARNVRRIRGDTSYAELSRLLTVLGRPIPPLGLRHLEEGSRRTDVDDLVVLAWALDVAPITLLLPEKRPELAQALFVHGAKANKPQVIIRQASEAREAFSDGDDQ